MSGISPMSPLPPEEWARKLEVGLPGFVDLDLGVVDVRLGEPGGLGSKEADRHALAALALHGQPFGFTREDVAALYALLAGAEDPSGWYGATAADERDAVESRVASLAARIAALLPPREESTL